MAAGELRDFTPADLARIRELTARLPAWGADYGEVTDELEAIHQAAGRRRGFMLWEWDGTGPGPFDPQRAYAEEIRGGIQPPRVETAG